MTEMNDRPKPYIKRRGKRFAIVRPAAPGEGMGTESEPYYHSLFFARRALKRQEEGSYHIKIITRDGGGQTQDDFHATVTRLSDGMELVFINDWLWFLKFRLNRWYLNREFNYHDKREKKLARKEEFTR